MMQKVDDKLVCKVYYAIGEMVDNYQVVNIKDKTECIDIIWEEVRRNIFYEFNCI